MLPAPSLRVLHVIPSVSEKHGGPTYALHAFARALQTQGVEVVIATTDDDGGRRRLNVPLGELTERRGAQHLFFRRDLLSYKVSFSLARWLKENIRRFDLVHVHALFSFSSCAAARAARTNGVPYIVRPLGVLNRWGMENRRPFLKRLSLNFVELPILRRAAAIHYTSQAERDEAVSLRPEIAFFPSFVVPIPVESPPKTDADAFFARYPAALGKKLVLFLSRLDPKKGLEILIEAFARLKEAEPNALLVLAGDGEEAYVKSLSALVGRLSRQSDVLWCGHLVGAEKAAAFAAATVFVLPSHSENFGIAAAEAMAAGVPTVISDQVALAEYATKSDAALVIQAEPEALANAISTILRDPRLAQSYAENGRRLVNEMFSPHATGRQLQEIYRHAVVTNAKASVGR